MAESVRRRVRPVVPHLGAGRPPEGSCHVLSKPPNRLQRAAARFNAVLHAQRGSDGAPWQRFRILRDLFIRSGAGNALLMRLSALGLVARPRWRKTHVLPLPDGFGAATVTVTL